MLVLRFQQADRAARLEGCRRRQRRVHRPGTRLHPDSRQRPAPAEPGRSRARAVTLSQMPGEPARVPPRDAHGGSPWRVGTAHLLRKAGNFLVHKPCAWATHVPLGTPRPRGQQTSAHGLALARRGAPKRWQGRCVTRPEHIRSPRGPQAEPFSPQQTVKCLSTYTKAEGRARPLASHQ